MYAGKDFKTVEELILAIDTGKKVTVFRPSVWREFIGKAPTNGKVSIEGPYRTTWVKGLSEHDWFATAFLKNGVIVRVE